MGTARPHKSPPANGKIGRAPPPGEQVRGEWARRVEAEYRSAALTHHLTLWLIQLGAPHGLLRTGLRIVSDELTHAELSAAVYRAAGGEALPQLERDTLRLPRTNGEPLERDLLRVAVEQFCLGETVAVRIFSRMRTEDNVPSVRRALDRILRDEVVHRDFGWSLLEWLLSTPLAPTFRSQLIRELPAMLTRLRENYGGLLLEHHGARSLESIDRELTEGTRGWGTISTLSYVAAVDEAFQRDFEPRFLALEVELPAPASAPPVEHP
jgi:hypothetical protein